MTRTHHMRPLADRGPLRVLFTITSMPVGGAETLLVELVRRMDRERILPELCCLKELGPLGEQLAEEIPAHAQLLSGKYDLRVFPRLVSLIRQRRIDAVITVGAGDKMFWGRLAAWYANLPVTLSALHSTGWPDTISRLNRCLTPLTDSFIAVAKEHGRYLIEDERLPAEKVRVIPNGVDTERFRPCPETRSNVRRELGLASDTPVCGIVAALRTEKNHFVFLRAAAMLRSRLPQARFLIVGDGPERAKLATAAADLGLANYVQFVGTRSDIHRLLTAMDLFALTSDSEASPVSILEAMATGLPVVATRVGSIAETVQEGKTGLLTTVGAAEGIAACWYRLLQDPALADRLGSDGRQAVAAAWSLDGMVDGYQSLIEEVYERKCSPDSQVHCGSGTETVEVG